MKAPHITASQDSSHMPWARRTRLCWVNFIFNNTMARSRAPMDIKTEEKDGAVSR